MPCRSHSICISAGARSVGRCIGFGDITIALRSMKTLHSRCSVTSSAMVIVGFAE